ncbi:hypothetical protein B2J93_668 [Marssonina coronariae]|uniref:Enoyl reductase (ER) domain-containing protein n=1 Tax=Diplocarpon coronariae TaxID=2795749 RepID=A0A218Z7Z6_9HELO|nr:hypothetical protein B2J93_668 [Marssonina coronariae]
MPKAIVMKHLEGKPGKVYYPLQLTEVPPPSPGPHELLIRIHAAALNHRDFFLRQALYPAPSFDVPLLADGCGVVQSAGTSASPSWVGKRVILVPGRGWTDCPEGPEAPAGYQILGGTKAIPLGTLQEVVAIHEDEVEEAPAHLSRTEAAALPLTGLTAWRAYVTKSGNALPGRNILITGIGGGVALNVLQFVVAMAGNAFVTSGSLDKIDRAKEMGAKGGVIYKTEGWEKELKKILPQDRPYIDAVIDGAGSDVIAKGTKLLKHGGVVVQYGMTVSPKMDWSMNAVLKNLELRGSTMGSRREFKDMVAFVNEKKIKPVISRSVKGLENMKDIDGLFDDIKNGSQFGKLVIDLLSEEGAAIDFRHGLGKRPPTDWGKVERAIEVTRNSKERLTYVWIDTCCIDKSNTSELSEAINLIFNWYARAVVCYAQIADDEGEFVPATDASSGWALGHQDVDSSVSGDSALTETAKTRVKNCRWLTRGWTLQEVITPPTVWFFDRNWRIDRKISEVPRNSPQQQNIMALLSKMTIVKKMSWAQNRQTYKTEDIAYSLLGIFGVNMAMTCVLQFHGILAHSPAEFADAGSLELSRNAITNPDFTLTINGLKINAQVRNIPDSKYLFLGLNCSDRSDGPQNTRGFTLQVIGFKKDKRTKPSSLTTELGSRPFQPKKEFFISADNTDVDTEHLDRSENQPWRRTGTGWERLEEVGKTRVLAGGRQQEYDD